MNPCVRSTHGFTKTTLDRFRGRCDYHTGSADRLSLQVHACIMKCRAYECACGQVFISVGSLLERGNYHLFSFLRTASGQRTGKASAALSGQHPFPPDGLCYVMLCAQACRSQETGYLIGIALKQQFERYEHLPACAFSHPAFHDRRMALQAGPVCKAYVIVAAASKAIEHRSRASKRATEPALNHTSALLCAQG